MNFLSSLIILTFLTALCATLFGLFNRNRNRLVAIAGFLIAPIAAILAWYAFVESHSIGFAIGYGTVAVIGFIAGFRNALSRKTNQAHD